MRNGGVRSKKTKPENAFVKMPRHVLEDPNWQHLRYNALRFIMFLMLEHLRHGGRENGRLKATYDQLVDYGIGRRLIRDAIFEATNSGCVRITRLGGRHRAALYELTWLESSDRKSGLWMHQHEPTLVHRGEPVEPD